jgi:hypothetical protein
MTLASAANQSRGGSLTALPTQLFERLLLVNRGRKNGKKSGDFCTFTSLKSIAKSTY